MIVARCVNPTRQEELDELIAAASASAAHESMCSTSRAAKRAFIGRHRWRDGGAAHDRRRLRRSNFVADARSRRVAASAVWPLRSRSSQADGSATTWDAQPRSTRCACLRASSDSRTASTALCAPSRRAVGTRRLWSLLGEPVWLRSPSPERSRGKRTGPLELRHSRSQRTDRTWPGLESTACHRRRAAMTGSLCGYQWLARREVSSCILDDPGRPRTDGDERRLRA